MIEILLFLSGVVNILLAVEFRRALKKYRVEKWKYDIVQGSLQKKYQDGIDTPESAKIMEAMRRGLL